MLECIFFLFFIYCVPAEVDAKRAAAILGFRGVKPNALM
jgi:hypothetical protein